MREPISLYDLILIHPFRVLASGAPHFYFQSGLVPPGSHDYIVSNALGKFCNRSEIERRLHSLAGLPAEQINRELRLHPDCGVGTNGTTIDHLRDYIHEAVVGLVEANLPYPARREGRLLPAWPLQHACSIANQMSNTSGSNWLAPIHALLHTYYNYSGEARHGFCIRPECECSCPNCSTQDISIRRPQLLARTYQHCTELVYTRCSHGPPNDVFWPVPNNACRSPVELISHIHRQCQATLSALVPDYNANASRFDPLFPSHTGRTMCWQRLRRGLYVSGEYSPWSTGTLRHGDPSAQLHTFPLLDEAAAGIELRQPNSCDPPAVVDLRYRLVRIMQCWHRGNTTGECDPRSLGGREVVRRGGVSNDGGECQELVRGYPWGREFGPYDESAGVNSAALMPVASLFLLHCILVCMRLIPPLP